MIDSGPCGNSAWVAMLCCLTPHHSFRKLMVLAIEVWVLRSNLNSPPQRVVIVILNLLKAVVNVEGVRGDILWHWKGEGKMLENLRDLEVDALSWLVEEVKDVTMLRPPWILHATSMTLNCWKVSAYKAWSWRLFSRTLKLGGNLLHQ